MTNFGSNVWNIVLAAGDGTRLAPLTRRLHGDDRPKQFAVLAGQRSMLQDTIERLSVVAPAARTVVVVGESHTRYARPQLVSQPALDLVPQPRNVGTAPGLLLPLARVLARDPEASVVVSPSDHHFRRPGRFIGKLRYALAAADAAPAGVCLLAVQAESPSTELGWIVPGEAMPARPGANLVSSFVEKPDARHARVLHDAGALWNTFVLVGSARRLWELVRGQRPDLAALFDRYRAAVGGPYERDVLAALYRVMPVADMSRDVLARSQGLAVTAVGGAGWSDWGTENRLWESLAGTAAGAALERRLAASEAAA